MDVTAVGQEYAPQALTLQSNQTVGESVANSEPAIGYCGLGYIVPRVEPLSVAALGEGEAVTPSPENVKDGSYPISRPLYRYTDGEPAGVLTIVFVVLIFALLLYDALPVFRVAALPGLSTGHL